jgi:hypothetical protein
MRNLGDSVVFGCGGFPPRVFEYFSTCTNDPHVSDNGSIISSNLRNTILDTALFMSLP